MIVILLKKKVFREFYNSTRQFNSTEALSEIEWDFLWSITNGLLPLGGMFGALVSGYWADYFGRFAF